MKKLLSLTLSFLLIFSALPLIMASADVTLPETYGNDADFAALVSGKSSVTLDKDYVLTEPVSCSISTLSLNGFTITYKPSAGNESANVITSTSAITVNIDTTDTAYEKANGTFVNYGTGYFFKSSTVTFQGIGSYSDGRTYGDLAVDGNLVFKGGTYYHYGNTLSTKKTSLNGDATKFYGNVDTKDFYFERVVDLQGYLHTTGNDVNLGKCNPYSGKCQTIYFTGDDTYNGYTIYCEGNATYAFNTERITLNTDNGRNILKKDMYVGGDLNVTWFGHTELGFAGKVVVEGNVLVNNYQTKKSTNHPDVTTPKNVTFANLVCEGQSLQLTENYHNADVENVVTVYDSGSAVTVTPYARLENVVVVKVDDEIIFTGKSGEKVTLPEPTTEGVIAYTDGEKLYFAGDEYVVSNDITFTNIKTIIDSSSDHDFVFDTKDKTYTSSEICPAVTSATLVEGEDYVVSYENNVNAGTATIKVLGIGNCFIDISADFTIIPKTLEISDFSIADDGLVYTGEAIEPEISSEIFNEDDYTVKYFENVNAGNKAYALIEATDKNGYGTVQIPFSIAQKEISDEMFTFDLDNKVFEDKEICPVVTSETLGFSTDYTVGYSNNINVGTAFVFVEGIGNYCGRIDKTFDIVAKEITADMFTVDEESKIYTAKEICPQVTSILGEDDYEVTYSNNVDIGVATITITGTGNYAGTLEYNFDILQKEIGEEDFDFDLADKAYTGKEICPQVTSNVLKDADYQVAYANNIDAGTATITITGVGNCKGEITKTFTINKKVISVDDFEIDLSDKEYENKELTPEITSTLTKDVDYTVVYSNNVNVGKAKIIITACGNNCQGEVEVEFEIAQRELKADDFAIEATEYVFDNREYTPAVSSLLKDSDYTVDYKDNKNTGTAIVIITGKDNCTGEVELEFTIKRKDIEKDWFVLAQESVTYTGSDIEVDVVSELVKDADYTVSYKNNVNHGTATVTIEGIGNYQGEKEYTFFIGRKSVEESMFTVDTASKVFANGEIKPEISSELVLGTDYSVIYANNTNVGTAEIIITGEGNYDGQVAYEFEITPKPLDAESFVFDTKNVVYTGSEIKPQVMGILPSDCYEVTYENNVNVGEGKIIVTGKGNYKDTVTATFNIVTKSIIEGMFAFDLDKERVYSGKAYEDAVTSDLVKDVDYTIAYENNVNAGEATVTITGIGNYAGVIVKTFAISQKAIDQTMFKIDKTLREYTGKAHTPELESNLAKGVDYVLAYANNKNVGKATITVTGIGNYQGELNYTFTIKKPTVKKVKGVKTTSTTAKSLTVKWKKTAGAKGYVIHVSLKKNFKGKKVITVANQKTVKKLIKKLKSGKKYYVRVAAYKNYKNAKGQTVKAIGEFTKVKRAITVK